MSDRIRELFTQRDQNCAETMLRATAEEMGIELTDDEMRLIGGFGGGMGRGTVCGALAGVVAAFGRQMVVDRAHAVPELKARCAAFVDRFEREFGSIMCADLKEHHYKDGKRCLGLVERAGALMREEIAEREAGRS